VNSNLPLIRGLLTGSYDICPSPNNSPVVTSHTVEGIINLDNCSLDNSIGGGAD
jgi:hypothetical protein